MTDCIIAKNLSVTTETGQILSNINVKISQEDFLILFGADNSGKSTFLGILMGFLKDYAGYVSIYGKPLDDFYLTNTSPIRFVPDDIITEKDMTAENYFCFMRSRSAGYKKEIEQLLCEKYDIDPKEQLLNMTYQDNKLTAIIAAISSVPKLLILDEPYNFLEHDVFNNILDDLEILHRKGSCIIISAEKYDHVSDHGNKYIYFHDGCIKSKGVIPINSYRPKAVTIPQKYISQDISAIGSVINQQKDTVTYRYSGNIQKLLAILQKTGCDDCTIKNIPLEDVLDKYSKY